MENEEIEIKTESENEVENVGTEMVPVEIEILPLEKEKKPFGKIKWIILICSIILVLSILVYFVINSYLDREKKVILFTNKGYEYSGLTYLTNERTLRDFLDAEGIEYDEDMDKIDCDLDSYLKDETRVELKKGFYITLDVDGNSEEFNAFDISIDKLLLLYDIEEQDGKIEVENDSILPSGEYDVTSLSISYEKVEKEIPYEKVWVEDKELSIGDTKVLTDGITGLTDDIYLVISDENGEVSRVVVRSDVKREVTNLQIAYGMKVDWSLPENFTYIDVIEDVKAVSYVYSGRPYGVYGLWCSYGTAAVDRSVIPLGSLLYIPGYGYAIANDVGSGIHGNVIDLYMERWIQCSKWGARKTKIYIISYGDDTTNWSRYKRDESLKYYDENGVFRVKEE